MVDDLDDLPWADQKRIAIPYDTAEEEYSQCTYYEWDYTNYTIEELCYEEDFSNLTRPTYECNTWEYNRTEFVDNPVSQVRLSVQCGFLFNDKKIECRSHLHSI